MCNVAGLYVEAKAQKQEDQAMAPIGDEFDMYLNQLGFMPMEDHAMACSGDADDMSPFDIPPVQVADWFLGNRNMLGLLEQDLSEIYAPGSLLG